MNNTPRKIWQEYEESITYNTEIGLYDNIEKNNKFYNDEQWLCEDTKDLDKPQFNIFKIPINLNSQILYSDDIGFDIDGYSKLVDVSQYQDLFNAVKQEIDCIHENEKFKVKLQDGLVTAQINGDMAFHFYFDPDFKIAPDVIGTIRIEPISPENVGFSNKATAEIDRQEWVSIARRITVADAIEFYSQFNKGEPPKFVPDCNNYTIDDAEKYTQNMVTVIYKYWRNKETQSIHCTIVTKDTVIRKEWDTGLSRIPVAWGNWEQVRKCYHGNALITGLRPNQVFINKLYAMAMLNLKLTGFPKVIYDRNKLTQWDNTVGGAIEVDGVNGRLDDVAKYLEPPSMNYQISPFLQEVMTSTQNLMGANEALRGQLNAQNTSAIIALQQSSAVSLKKQQRAFRQFIEDCIRVEIDMIATYYGQRRSAYEQDGEPVQINADFSQLKDIAFRLDVNVGASAFWSDYDLLSTLDNLFAAGLLTPVEYLSRFPDGRLKDKQEIIDRITNEGQTQGNADINTAIETEIPNPEMPEIDESVLLEGVM